MKWVIPLPFPFPPCYYQLAGSTQDAQQSSEITFEKPEPLEEVCTDEGVTEIEQKSTEEHPFTVDID